MTEWNDHPAYWKLVSEERKYTALCECKGLFCGWTCVILSTIFFSPLVWFCIDCWMN